MNKKKRKSKFTAAQKRAYWIGVGMNAERYGDSERSLDHPDPNIRNSARRGYNDENIKDLTRVKFPVKKAAARRGRK